MFIAAPRPPSPSKLRRSGMIPFSGRRTVARSCRSYGAWVHFLAVAGYKHGAPSGAFSTPDHHPGDDGTFELRRYPSAPLKTQKPATTSEHCQPASRLVTSADENWFSPHFDLCFRCFVLNLRGRDAVRTGVRLARQPEGGRFGSVAGVVQTQRAAYRQFNAIISDLNYTLPSLDA